MTVHQQIGIRYFGEGTWMVPQGAYSVLKQIRKHISLASYDSIGGHHNMLTVFMVKHIDFIVLQGEVAVTLGNHSRVVDSKVWKSWNKFY